MIYYTVQITSSNPPFGSFNIYYDSTSNIATLNTPPYLPATNISYSSMIAGVDVILPNTAKQIIVEDNTTCNNKCCKNISYVDITPTFPEEIPDLCMTAEFATPNTGPSPFPLVNVQFTTDYLYSGTFNGKPYWTSNDTISTLIWSTDTNTNISFWVVSSSTPTNYTILNYNTSSPPTGESIPNGYWQVLGSFNNQYYINVTEGSCIPPEIMTTSNIETKPLSIPYSETLQLQTFVNQTICGCDGSITINANGGVPPYMYSINSGVTFKNFPIFNDLCFGIYNVLVKDSLDVTSSNIITLNQPLNPVTYTLYLSTTSQVLSYTNNLITKKYDTRVLVSPTLPDGVSISFSLSHLNTSKSSPNLNSSSATTTSILLNNLTPISATTTNISTGTTLSTLDGCQLSQVYITTTNEEWNILILDNSTEILLTTITTIEQNESIDCYIGTSDELYLLSNASINGCGCCNVII